MKLTLLQLTQSILSSLDSDEVNSVSDTTESLQVANIIKTTYNNIITRVGTEEHNQLIQLDPSLDNTIPVMMHVPAGVNNIEWIKYFNSNPNAFPTTTSTHQHDLNVDIVPNTLGLPSPIPGYQYVTILPIKQFLDYIDGENPTDPNVSSFMFNDTSNNFNNQYKFYFRIDKQPQYCTILSNYYVIFDGFDSTVDSTLQASKTQVFSQIIPEFKMEDSFIPNLAEEQFPLLLNEAKSLAFFELKQSPHPKAEQEAKRGWSTVQRNKALINRPTYFDQLANFGRRGRNSAFFKSVGWDKR